LATWIFLPDASAMTTPLSVTLSTLPISVPDSPLTVAPAADFLTRATSVLGGIFIVLSIVMAAIAGATREPVKVDTSLVGQTQPAPTQNQTAPAQAPTTPAPQENKSAPAVPLAQ
jgi:preprotein translocase subunit SecG